ncbi:MAG: peptidylprolyl isomerase [Gammaproteobacteria bacterium]|nr:peptidylprolyl isomerase [Gammaproteobacteria bacterium]
MNKLFLSLLLSLPACIIPIAGQTQLVFGPGPEGAASTLDAIAAVVNDDVITHRELDTAIVLVERQMRQKKVPPPPQADLKAQVLERLILSQLELRAAERQGITVDDTTLNAAIDNLARRNKMNLTQLRQTVEKDGISFAKFRDEVRRELMTARLRQKVIDSQIQISDQDVESVQTQLTGQTAPGTGGEYHIAQILIAVAEGASPEQIATAKRQAEDVLARLNQGDDFGRLAASVSAGQQALEGGDLGWRRADQLPTLFADVVLKLQPGQFSELIRSPSGFHIVKLLDIRGSDPRPNTQQAAMNQTRARHILLANASGLSDDEARQRLHQLRQRIQAGEDFASLASEHSDDKTSGARGGDLGWVAPGMLVPEFEQEMAQLQTNEISAPFKTQFGWHIVQVLDRRQVQASTTDMERAQVREALFRRRSDEEWEQWLRRLRDEAYVEIRLRPTQSAATTTP